MPQQRRSINLIVVVILATLTVVALGSAKTSSTRYLVNVPVANLRSAPNELDFTYQLDMNQQTQVLYCDPVVSTGKINGNYIYVEAITQQTYVNGTLMGYPGWMNLNDLVEVDTQPVYTIVVSRQLYAPIYDQLCTPFACMPENIVLYASLGTLLEATNLYNGWWQVSLSDGSTGYILDAAVDDLAALAKRPTERIADELVRIAKTMLGWNYFWGGRSAFNADFWTDRVAVTGVDCSGLVSLVYRAQGILLARNADDIAKQTCNVSSPADLQKGDLLFAAHSDDPEFIMHVMLYIGDGLLIESNFDFDTGYGIENNNGTRMFPVEDKFGVPLQELRWSQPLETRPYCIYWGSILRC